LPLIEAAFELGEPPRGIELVAQSIDDLAQIGDLSLDRGTLTAFATKLFADAFGERGIDTAR
jgi:hypothetical protein